MFAHPQTKMLIFGYIFMISSVQNTVSYMAFLTFFGEYFEQIFFISFSLQTMLYSFKHRACSEDRLTNEILFFYKQKKVLRILCGKLTVMFTV